MKNSFLYGAIIALVLVVIGLGYTKYAREHATPVTDEPVVMTDTIGTDEDAAAVALEGTATETAIDTAVDMTTPEAVVTEETVTGEAATTDSVSAEAPVVEGEEATPAPEATTDEAADDQSLLAPPTSLQLNVAEMMADRVLGDAAAPVTIIEFASFTCSHCATFSNDILPRVKSQLIDTGKAKLILHEFPLDKFALKASMLARCAPADKYYDLVEVFFRNQDRWIKAEDPIAALKQLGSLTGMDDAQMENCMGNVELENALLARVTEAQGKYNVKATPTFVFNDGAESFSGSQSLERFQQAVDQLTQ